MPFCFVTCGPNELMVVSGCCHRKPALIQGGRVFVCPFVKIVDTFTEVVFVELQIISSLPLNLMTILVESPRVYTSQGVPISVTGVAQIKIQSQNEEMLWVACEMFLGMDETDISNIACATLEGHQRAIMGTMTVEEIYKDRKKFNENVFEVASSDLVNMGITVVSYTLKDIRDDAGYLISLGMERTAQVKRDGRIGEAEANRDSKIKEAKAEMERMASRLYNDTEIARSKRNFELKKAEYEVETLKKKADAENAFELRALQVKEKIIEEKTGVDIIEKIQNIALEEQEVLRKTQELDSTVRVPSDAEKYRLDILADASLKKLILEAESEAESLRVRGEAEGYAITKKAEADAEQMEKKSKALDEYTGAALIEMVMEVLPRVAGEVTSAMAKTDKITVVSNGPGYVGPAKIAEEVFTIIERVPEAVKSITGLDIASAVKNKM